MEIVQHILEPLAIQKETQSEIMFFHIGLFFTKKLFIKLRGYWFSTKISFFLAQLFQKSNSK